MPVPFIRKEQFHSQASILAFQIQFKAPSLENFLSQGQHISKNIDHHSRLVYDHLILSVWDGASLLVRLMFTVCPPSLGIREALAHHLLAPGVPHVGSGTPPGQEAGSPREGLPVCVQRCLHLEPLECLAVHFYYINCWWHGLASYRKRPCNSLPRRHESFSLEAVKTSPWGRAREDFWRQAGWHSRSPPTL